MSVSPVPALGSPSPPPCVSVCVLTAARRRTSRSTVFKPEGDRNNMRTTDFLGGVARDDQSDDDEEVMASRLRASREQMSTDRKKKKVFREEI